MNHEEINKEINKEDLIFALYKDRIVTCKAFKKMCREKYNIENPRDLYIKINNYQINKYGCQLLYETEKKEDWKITNSKGVILKQTKKTYYKERRYKIYGIK